MLDNFQSKANSESSPTNFECRITTRRSTRSTDNNEGKDFVKRLYGFMKSNRTPIGRIPSLGYKECKQLNVLLTISL